MWVLEIRSIYIYFEIVSTNANRLLQTEETYKVLLQTPILQVHQRWVLLVLRMSLVYSSGRFSHTPSLRPPKHWDSPLVPPHSTLHC